jgi:hypothetical protein
MIPVVQTFSSEIAFDEKFTGTTTESPAVEKLPTPDMRWSPS